MIVENPAAKSQQEDESRVKFERLLADSFPISGELSLERNVAGKYLCSEIEDQWKGWLLCMKSQIHQKVVSERNPDHAPNLEIAHEVSERAALWSGVRRAQPLQDVRRMMREAGVTAEDMVERLSLRHGTASSGSIAGLLRGASNIKIDDLYALADALKSSLSISFSKH